MVSARKRGRQEMEAVEPPKERSLIERIRNMWEFANLAQWIFIFGGAVKLDENLDIEELEMEFLKTESTVLPDIGLALLKFVSSHRGLTPEIFDEYTRRQYVAKAPLRNPFGTDEEPAKFMEFDVFTKIRILQQLTQWTMGNPDRIRERMEEQKDTEQTIWRIEPFGWDSEDRTYFVLDDNRLYRRTDPPPSAPVTAPKKNSKKAKAALRASKRRKISQTVDSDAEPLEEIDDEYGLSEQKEDDGFGGMIWNCVAITLDEYNAFTSSIEKSRDPNEKGLRKRIIDDVLPLLEKQEESRKRKAAQKERELLNLEKLATAKRSSRIRGKVEQQKHEEEAREAERRKQADLVMAKKEQERWLKLEKERESRMMTREQRLKEREARRILHEEELANLSEDNKKLESGQGRLSERHLKAEIEKKKLALEELAEEEDWIFDCICGAYGQIDDGTHSIACEKCNIWQHSKCVGVSQTEAERDDFHFICKTCERRAKDEERARTQPPIKIKINRPGSSSSPTAPKFNGSPYVSAESMANGVVENASPRGSVQHASPGQNHSKPSLPQLASWQTGSTHSPKIITPQQSIQQSNQQLPPLAQSNGPSPASKSPEITRNADPSPRPIPSTYIGPYGASNGSPVTLQQAYSRPSSSHAFSSPHPHSPTSLPPPQPQVYTFVNGNAQTAQHTISHQNTGRHLLQMQSSPSVSANHGNAGPPPLYLPNGPRPGAGENNHRRTSISMPSPLTSAPILTPSNKQNPPQFASHNDNTENPTSASNSSKLSPMQIASSPVSHVVQSQDKGTSQNPALPPAVTGLSPTKHSPPRPSSSDANMGSATPSMLPPVTSLSPSPQMPNLTPPIKPSEGEWTPSSNRSMHPQTMSERPN